MESFTAYGVTDTLSEQNLKYSPFLNVASDAFIELDELFKSTEYEKKIGWKKEGEDEHGAIVHSKNMQQGKMVTIRTILPAHMDLIKEETWDGMEKLPNWNPNVAYAKQLAVITPNFDICNYGHNDLFFISGREVVCTRMYRKTEHGYLLATRSIDHDDCPERKDKVRAHIFLGGARMMPHPTKDNTTIIDAVMLADPKGLLPKALVNQVIGKITLLDSKHNRLYFEELSRKKSVSARS